MVYVVDTGIVSALHRNYFPERFPTLWKLFDQMVASGLIASTRESFLELEDFGGESASWATANKDLFPDPDTKEAKFVSEIYAVKHFQANISRQQLLKGGRCADPFIVARARNLGATVVTTEKLRANAAKIPNICDHFKVKWVNLDGFMTAEKWQF